MILPQQIKAGAPPETIQIKIKMPKIIQKPLASPSARKADPEPGNLFDDDDISSNQDQSTMVNTSSN